jgi:hypothetical protein
MSTVFDRTPSFCLNGAKRINLLAVPSSPKSTYELLYGQCGQGRFHALLWQTPGNFGKAPISVAQELKEVVSQLGAHPDTVHWHFFRPGHGGQYGEISVYEVSFLGEKPTPLEVRCLSRFCKELGLCRDSMYRQVLSADENLGRTGPPGLQKFEPVSVTTTPDGQYADKHTDL